MNTAGADLGGMPRRRRWIQRPPGALRAAAGLIEALTQKLLALDNIAVDGDPGVRQARKAQIVRINSLCDALEAGKSREPV